MSLRVSSALLLRKVRFGEADTIVTLFTECDGKVSVMARGAARSSRRFGGLLEPFQTFEASWKQNSGDLGALQDAKLQRERPRLVTNLACLEAAGTAMRLVRRMCPPRTREPEAWQTLVSLLDRLDEDESEPRIELAIASLRLLGSMGYALALDRCVQCNRPCPAGKAAHFNIARGGIVCSACGGAHTTIGAPLRHLMQRMQSGENDRPSDHEAAAILAFIDQAVVLHAEN